MVISSINSLRASVGAVCRAVGNLDNKVKEVAVACIAAASYVGGAVLWSAYSVCVQQEDHICHPLMVSSMALYMLGGVSVIVLEEVHDRVIHGRLY